MRELIDKAAVVAELDRIEYETNYETFTEEVLGKRKVCKDIKDLLDKLKISDKVSYEKKYKEALGWMKSLYGGLHGKTKEEAEKYFPELQDSEDERMRKMCMKYLDREYQHCSFADDKKNIEKCIVWLEKQGDKSVNIDIESMVSSYKQRLKSQGGVENTPLVNMCLTAFRQGVENVLDELSLKKLEKQGKPKWSDEDEKRLQSCIVELQGKGLMGSVDTIDTKWLKSLKQRMEEQ